MRRRCQHLKEASARAGPVSEIGPAPGRFCHEMGSYPYSAEEKRRADEVRDMFGSIARRYDLLNHLLSANIDRRWREACVREVLRRTALPHPKILDLGCGTADLALAFPRSSPVFGSDFSRPMLDIARKKINRSGRDKRVTLLAADALALPFADGAFDAVVSAFVVRNLANRTIGLAEMKRVLRPGGVVGILDFSMPAMPLLGRLCRFYILRVLPGIGQLVSGVSGAYRYLPESIGEFPGPDELSLELVRAGFLEVGCRRLTSGVAVLWSGRAPW